MPQKSSKEIAPAHVNEMQLIRRQASSDPGKHFQGER